MRASGCRAGCGPSPGSPRRRRALHTDVLVIAAVNGAAVGWGHELALLADIRIAPERARFGELFVKRGLCCDVAGLGRTSAVIGRERAAELLFTGRIVGADEAAGMGLLSRAAARGPAARRWASQPIAESPARRPEPEGPAQALDPDRRALGVVSRTSPSCFGTDDHREGVAAFLEKREPRYGLVTGRERDDPGATTPASSPAVLTLNEVAERPEGPARRRIADGGPGGALAW